MNNARLTSALQESTANVDEWKRQLQQYKEENMRIKARYADLEAGKVAEGNSEALKLRVEALENELRTRNEELKAMNMATKNKDFQVSNYSLNIQLLRYRLISFLVYLIIQSIIYKLRIIILKKYRKFETIIILNRSFVHNLNINEYREVNSIFVSNEYANRIELN